MKIIVDNNGNINAVARDSENLLGSINVVDNEDLLINPAKYKWDNNVGNVVLKPYVEIETDSITDVNSNGIKDVPVNGIHKISITYKNADGTTNININKQVEVDIINLMSYENDNRYVDIINGVGTLELSYSSPKVVRVSIKEDFDMYVNALLIEYI